MKNLNKVKNRVQLILFEEECKLAKDALLNIKTDIVEVLKKYTNLIFVGIEFSTLNNKNEKDFLIEIKTKISNKV